MASSVIGIKILLQIYKSNEAVHDINKCARWKNKDTV